MSQLICLNARQKAGAIEASHARARAYGIDPRVRKASPLPRRQIEERIRANQAFISLAAGQIKLLRDMLHTDHFFIAAADADGYLLHIDGGPEICAIMASRSCTVGYSLHERLVGTTATGLCLALGQPFQLSDKEHYFQRAQDFTSSASPVFDPEGRLLGAMMVTCTADKVHLHTLAMIVSCARAIELQLTEISRAEKLALQAGILDSTLEAMGAGLMILDERQEIRRVNETGRRIVDPETMRRALLKKLGLSAEAIYRHPEQWNNRELSFQIGRETLHLQLTAKAVTLPDNFCAGIVLSYNKVNTLHKVLDPSSGSRAHFTFEDIVGSSGAIRECRKLTAKAAMTDAPVLLMGETGTGKELFAQAIHNASDRRRKPFVPINCGAIPKELLESELFGYVSGAFTGASKSGQPGKFELASGGTILLDEIGDMPYSMQLRLLRVLQTQEIYRIGSAKPVPVNIRVIASTNVDLSAAIARGRFRHDLYYRLNVFPVYVPPLRERGVEDILDLANHFLIKGGFRNMTFSERVLEEMASYPWPGNVRELENCICRGAHLAGGPIIDSILEKVRRPAFVPKFDGWPAGSGRDLAEEEPMVHHNLVPPPVFEPSAWAYPGSRAAGPDENPERRLLAAALSAASGDVLQSCRMLKLSRATLYRKIKRHGLSLNSYRS